MLPDPPQSLSLRFPSVSSLPNPPTPSRGPGGGCWSPAPGPSPSAPWPPAGVEPPGARRPPRRSRGRGWGRGLPPAASSLLSESRPAKAQALIRRAVSRQRQCAVPCSLWLQAVELSLAMTVKTEAARGTLTYSRMRGMVAILIGECRHKTALTFEDSPSGNF